MAMNHGALTGSAGSYPSRDILVDAMPHKALRDELLRGHNSWISQVVDIVGNQAV